jgi:glycosyltransferase involved in cell wall biosynthesis
MNKITILAFNYGHAGRLVNGPGMCLDNFISFMRSEHPEIIFDIYTELMPSNMWANVKSIRNSLDLKKSIIESDFVHVWSGMTDRIKSALSFSEKLNKKIIIGPNVIDTVYLEREKLFLKDLEFFKLLTMNSRLRYKISKDHTIPVSKIDLLVVGPDPKVWTPPLKRDGTILWKGNGSQAVKDISFAKEIEKQLSYKYKFKFIGDKNGYNYHENIEDARKSSICIVTSLSETMGLAMMESWSAGIPSVTHPKIYMHGENYKTGIITSKTIDNYIEAIEELMSDEEMLSEMSITSRNYILNNFSSANITKKYINILSNIIT